jgi:PPP family 3-phenylpropionic acid transporter
VAQAIYGTVGVGLASAVLTLTSGWLYGEYGVRGFWGMFIVGLAALPAIWRLSRLRNVGLSTCAPTHIS